MNKPNCYKCKFRGSVPGSAHSSCIHPSLNRSSDQIDSIVALFSGKYNKVIDDLNIIANPHGIRKGWFNWPIDFDPVWLENCDGFESKE